MLREVHGIEIPKLGKRGWETALQSCIVWAPAARSRRPRGVGDSVCCSGMSQWLDLLCPCHHWAAVTLKWHQKHWFGVGSWKAGWDNFRRTVGEKKGVSTEWERERKQNPNQHDFHRVESEGTPAWLSGCVFLWLKSWSSGPGMEPWVWLPARRGVCVSLCLSPAPPPPNRSLSLKWINKALKKKNRG